MKIIDFINGQRSDEWLKWRQDGIGASDIPVIMGTNRFSTPLKLWNKKCGYEIDDPINPAIQHGIDNEEIAKKWLEENLNLSLDPLCIEDSEHSYFKASLDGYDVNKKTLVEIKCPVSEEILENMRTSKKVPEYWLDQIQWQIMLCKPERAILAIWDPEEKKCMTLEIFCLPERQEEMKEKAHQFWRQVSSGIQPKATDQDYIVIESPELKNLVDEYGYMDEMEKAAKSRKKELKEAIIDHGDDGNFLSFGYRITRCSPKATHDLDKMRSDGIDVDKYLKKPNSIGFYKINVPRKRI